MLMTFCRESFGEIIYQIVDTLVQKSSQHPLLGAIEGGVNKMHAATWGDDETTIRLVPAEMVVEWYLYVVLS